jgi:hypothetical protein
MEFGPNSWIQILPCTPTCPRESDCPLVSLSIKWGSELSQLFQYYLTYQATLRENYCAA